MKLGWMKNWKALCAVISALGVCAGIVACSGSGVVNQATSAIANNKIKHVWVITLENENYSTTFSTATKSPYLAQTLTAQGAWLQQYYGTGHVSLDNYVSMVSGMPGTTQTIADCQTYASFTQTGTTTDGLPIGTGCIYPAATLTIADQLTAIGATWKGYEGDMGNDPTREATTCGHPAVGAADLTQVAEAPSTAVPAGDQYATRHNPFMYFHSIIDSSTCGAHVVNLNNNLASDLNSISSTPNFSFITPSLCDDGHDAPCVDGRPGGLTSADAFLQKWIPAIQASAAYKQDGLIIINFDESSSAGTTVNGSTITATFTGTVCCNQQPGPNLGAYPMVQALPYGGVTYNIAYNSYGGDQTGAVLLSPFIKPGTVSTVPYNHYSMLRTIEDIFAIPTHLGYANQSGLVSMGTDVFTNAQ